MIDNTEHEGIRKVIPAAMSLKGIKSLAELMEHTAVNVAGHLVRQMAKDKALSAEAHATIGPLRVKIRIDFSTAREGEKPPGAAADKN